MHIMIVDDNARVRRTLKSLLQHLPVQLIEASNGIEAVEQYGRYHPEIVLMDVRMPEMGGIEATACIRSINPEACVVMVTEYDDPALRHNADFAGATEYFLKENLMDLRQYIEALSNTLTGENSTSFGIYLS